MFNGWVSEVSANSTFTKAYGATWPTNGFDGIPSGWSVDEQ